VSGLTFPIRHFQFLGVYGPGVPYPPEAYEGPVGTALRIEPRRLGLVSVHCWNLSDPDGPFPFTPGVAGPISAQWERRAVEICGERLAPLMRAARAAGATVFHLASRSYADRYPQYRRVAADPELQAPPPGPMVPEGSSVPARCALPEAQLDHTAKATGPHYPGRPWVTMPEKFDIARVVRPEPEDEVVVDGWQLHALCHRKGIHTLLYAGFMADVCLMGVSGAIREMKERYGYRVVALRDCTTAFEFRDTLKGDDPAADGWMTHAALRRIELEYGYSADSTAVRAACERFADEAAAPPRETGVPAGEAAEG
jgi:nicotinamidase-related amidase